MRLVLLAKLVICMQGSLIAPFPVVASIRDLAVGGGGAWGRVDDANNRTIIGSEGSPLTNVLAADSSANRIPEHTGPAWFYMFEGYGFNALEKLNEVVPELVRK
jgi:hypothetical protein